MSERALLGPSTVMAAGTVTSRVTGIARDITMIAALGFFLVSDAFSLGNSLPNMIYILILGGALNAVFIPQLVRKMKDDVDDGRAYADRLITLTATALLALSIISIIFAPWIVDLYTPNDYPQSDFDLAVAFTRLCLPQIFFYGLYTMFSQVLNTRGKFGAPMFAPIANNIVAISTFLLFIYFAGTGAAADGDLTSGQIWLLGLGTTLGVVVQACILIPVLYRAGYVWRPHFDWRGYGLRKAGKLAAWTVGLVLVNQLTYLVITRFATQANINAIASGAAAAGLTTYQKAHLVFMLPHSVITVSVITALLPSLSRVAHSGKITQVSRDLVGAMRLVSFLIIPVTALIFVSGTSVAVLLFDFGAATTDQARILGQVISVFMLGMLPFTLFYVLLRGFYSLEDTRTPFFITVAFSLVFLGLLVPIFGLLTGQGVQITYIALCYSFSYWVGLVIAWIVLARKLGGLSSLSTIGSIARMLIVGILSVLVMLFIQSRLNEFFFGDTNIVNYSDKTTLLMQLILVILSGTISYIALSWIFRVPEIPLAYRVIREKLGAKVNT